MPVEAPVTSTVPEAIAVRATSYPLASAGGAGRRHPHAPHAQGLRARAGAARARSRSCSSWRAGRPTTTSPTRGASGCSAPSRWRAEARRPAPRRAAKLDRAPTLVVASQVRSDDADAGRGGPLRGRRRRSTYVLLGRARPRPGRLLAHARPCCATPEGRAAVGVPAGERVLGLIHLGPAAAGEGAARAPPARRLRNVPAVIPRADALAALERDSLRPGRGRRRHHRRRRGARRGLARLQRGAGRARPTSRRAPRAARRS